MAQSMGEIESTSDPRVEPFSGVTHRAGDPPATVGVTRGIVHPSTSVAERDQRHVLGVDRVDIAAVVTSSGHDALGHPEFQSVRRGRLEDPRAKPGNVGGDRGGGEVEIFGRRIGGRRITGVWRDEAAGRRVLPGRVDHGPGSGWIGGEQQLPGGDAQGVSVALAAADPLARLESEIEPVVRDRADDVLADAFARDTPRITKVVAAGQQPAASVGQCEQSWAAEPIGCCQPHARLVLPIQQVVGGGAWRLIPILLLQPGSSSHTPRSKQFVMVDGRTSRPRPTQ